MNVMEQVQESISEQIMIMLKSGHNREQIEAQLLAGGHEEEFVRTIVLESIKLHEAKKRSGGLTMILVGAVICFASFLLTITSSFSHSTFELVLYGLTSLGIVVAFVGLTRVF